MNKRKNLVKFLVIESALILVFGIIGSVIFANQKIVKYVEPKYSWETTGSYETKEEFNFTIFLAGTLGTVVLASIVYAVSEILDNVYDNNDILVMLEPDQTDVTPNEVKIEKTSIKESTDENITVPPNVMKKS